MSTKGPMGLEKVADEAGVSTATVSRVFNRPEMVAPATRRRVLEASKRVGNGTPPRKVLGLVVPDASNEVFSQFLHALEGELFDKGFQLIAASSNGRTEMEMEIIERFRAMGVSGILYVSRGVNSSGVLELASRGDIPIVSFNSRTRLGNSDSIVVSSRRAMQTMVDYFLNLDHEAFGYISGDLTSLTARDTLESFELALARNGLDPETASLQFEGDFSFASGRNFAELYMQMEDSVRPTAVIAASDAMAIGFMQRVMQSGIRVPDDVSVAGFDGTAFGEWYSPSLTTITTPIRRMAREGVRLLLERIEWRLGSETAAPQVRVVEVEPRFIARDSVAPRASSQHRRRLFRAIQ